MTNADLIASLVAGFFLLIVGIVLLVKIRGSQPEAAAVEEDHDATDTLPETGFEEDLVLTSLENLEFRVEATEAPEPAEAEVESIEAPEAEQLPSPEPVAAEEVETESAIEVEIPTELISASAFSESEPETSETQTAALDESPMGELPCPEPTEPVSPEMVGEFEPEEPVSEAQEEAPSPVESEAGVEFPVEAESEAEVAAELLPAPSAEATESPEGLDESLESEAATELIEEIEAEAEQIHAEIESMTENDADLRRATLRPAPSRKRRERQVSETLDSQITDLDHRLDALEALVASIEESLAEFEPLLEEEQDPHRAIAPESEKAEAA